MAEVGDGQIKQAEINRGGRFGESSRRLMKLLDVAVNSMFKKVEVEGEANLEKIPDDKKVIIVTTHVSDMDMPIIAKVLGNKFGLVITDLSIHRSPLLSLKSSDPTIGGVLIAGRENFLPISYSQEKGRRTGLIKREDSERIKEALGKGKTVMIAAHNPSFDGKMPPKPGFIATRCAQTVEDAIILPVSVDTSGGSKFSPKDLIRKKEARVVIGEPFSLNDPDAKIAGDRVEELLAKGNLNETQREELHSARVQFNRESEKIMRVLASLLPPEKRGKWG